MDIEQLFSGQISHAYIFHRTDAEHVLGFLEREHHLKFGANPNALKYEAETFSIEDSRALIQLTSLHGEDDTFVALVARTIGIEAQHALLKTLEEPRPGIHFLIFVDNPATLLPTLRSRCISVQKNLGAESDGKNNAKNKHPDFLYITLADRFAYVEKLSKQAKKDDDTNGFRDAAMEIFDMAIEKLREKMNEKDAAEKIERILELRGYLNDRGSSPKQLLETMAMQMD
jgi:DNA polymerase III delta prime subunit